MSAAVSKRSTCRLCESERLRLVLSLAPTPPANAFVGAAERGSAQEVFPLDLYFCEDCTHVQLLDVVDPSVLFEHYVYVSGTSPAFVRHFKSYAADVAAVAGPLDNALVVDIGSNDGTLLRAFRDDQGARILGIDPARNLAEAATAAGIETLPEFFTPAIARRIVGERGTAAVVTANNVFAHIDDLGGVVDGVDALLAPDGVFVFEVSYLLDVVEQVLFDTIYHEHLAYHSVRALIPFLARHGLEVIEAQRVATHGGSLRVIAQRAGAKRSRGASVDALLALEEAAGLHLVETFDRFARRIADLGAELKDLLHGLKRDGKSIAGFGAPAKATTLMYQFALDAGVIDYIIDDNPLKQGTFTPGMHIPVVSSDVLKTSAPDYLLILAWNFADPIIEKNRAFQDGGGHFIVPVPKVRVV